MFFRVGVLLAFAAVFLQIAVFLQPLLPAQYQVAPVCETITRALFSKATIQSEHPSHQHAEFEHQHHALSSMSSEHQHDIHHQCQYCTVYANLVLPPELELKEVFDRLQIRLVAFQKVAAYIWLLLQRLFLMPQGRAPPLFA